LLTTAGQEPDNAREHKLTPDAIVRFATALEGQAALTADDAFTANLSRFDLQCRMKTSKEVDLADWKSFVREHVREWEKDEQDAVIESIERLSKRLTGFRLPLPPKILLIRTSGEEEAGAAYTRGAAIALPTKKVARSPADLDRLLAHELFHLISRQDGAVRARLYRLIGFEPCDPIELPPSLAPRRITNPDAPLIDCTIDLVGSDGKTYTSAPILYASIKDYDPAGGKTLFQHLTFRLLVVERKGGRWQPLLFKNEPVVIDPRKEPVFFEKVGKNTNYIIHPDEILADNFVRLVMEDKDVETPRVVEEMRSVLKRP
jgi:hypothetical protein